jgi:hypothetical protein
MLERLRGHQYNYIALCWNFQFYFLVDLRDLVKILLEV